MCKHFFPVHAEGLPLDLNLMCAITHFNDDIFSNDRTKPIIGLGRVLFILSMD